MAVKNRLSDDFKNVGSEGNSLTITSDKRTLL